MKATVVFLLLILIVSFTKAQHFEKCATPLYEKILSKKYPQIGSAREKFEKQLREKSLSSRFSANADTIIYTIPIVVHVIHNNSNHIIGGLGNTNISNQQIYSQLEVLNRDYRRLNSDTINTPSIFKFLATDMRFEFCFASRDPEGNQTNGITRTYNSTDSWDVSDDGTFKALSYWPSDQYLNIWVLHLKNNYLGYAQLPYGSSLPGLDNSDPGAPLDGIVIHYTAFGTTGVVKAPYNLGRTVTHEIGHWIGGLRHPWGDVHCGDDYVADTPPQDDSNFDYKCNSKTSFCDSNRTIDMIENYMQYTGDNCMNLFTNGQHIRSRIAFYQTPRRHALINSKGCCGIGEVNDSLPFSEDFENNDLALKGWKIINPDTNNSWYRIPPGSYGKSFFSLGIQNNSSNTNNQYYLISPFLNFKNVKLPFLKFDLSYAKNSLYKTDTLIVSYNSSCDNNWIPLLILKGDSLSTSPIAQDNFMPLTSDWKTIFVDLKKLSGISGIKIRFENHSGGANNMFLDNIAFEVTSDNFQVKVYPNPTNHFINYEIQLKDTFIFKAELFNYIGQRIIERDASGANNYLDVIDISSLAPSVYFLRVTVNSQTKISKIIVDR